MSAPPARPRPSASAVAAALVALVAIALSVALKLTVEAGGPLWLDEGWTLGIVERPTWAGFVEQLRLDVNPPLYFLLLRGWTALFGLGDGALRGFSALCACALPLAATLPGAGADARDRWTWAALLALWGPGIAFAQEARGYALLAGLGAVQTALFAHLLAAPNVRRAAAWAGAAALSALTQHHAVLLLVAQGLALLAVERARVVRLWPAALAYAPALAWEMLQASRVLVFGRPEHAWYPPFTAATGEAAGEVLAGAWPAALGAVALAAAAAALARGRGAAAEPWSRRERALWIAATASTAAGLLLIGLGAWKPSLAARYAAPFAPGALLVPVLLLRGAAGRVREVARAVVVGVFAGAALAAAASADTASRRAYQFETASGDLMRAGVTRLLLLWDNPTDGALAPQERQALGDAFFVRGGRPLAVAGVQLRPGEDPNAALAAAAARTPGAAVLWLYDLRVPHTAARRFAPRLAALDPALSCRRYAGGALGVVACVRSPLVWTR